MALNLSGKVVAITGGFGGSCRSSDRRATGRGRPRVSAPLHLHDG